MEERPIVLLDEPFSALDARVRAEMQELAAQHLQGKTILLVTHDPAEAARLGESILVLSMNGIKDVCPPEGGIIRRMTNTVLVVKTAPSTFASGSMKLLTRLILVTVALFLFGIF